MRLLGRLIGQQLRTRRAEAAIEAAGAAIPFCCPYCEQETLVPLEYAGQSGPCVTCGKKITVPLVSPDQPLDDDEIVTGIPYRSATSPRTIIMITISAVVAATAAVAAVIMLLLPALGAARGAAYSHRCNLNLRRIGEALQAYEATYGTMPPAYIADASGKPMHSWRVLILPFLDEQGLYDDYDFSQPWDSLTNKQLTARMPAVYACPADPDAQVQNESNYVVIVGRNTLFPGAASLSTMTIRDDLSTTIAVVEVPVFGVTWLEPKDLNTRQMVYDINGTIGREIGSNHRTGAHVLMADGSVRFLGEEIPSDYVQGMTTANGEEAISWDLLD